MDPKAYRLPTHVRPHRYDLSLHARLDAPDFHGSVVIELELDRACPTLELHALRLELSNAWLTTATGRQPAAISCDPQREIAVLSPATPVLAGHATLEIDFAGTISTNLEGLYLAQDGPEAMLCAQAFPTAARTIFPCFDEPTFKAQWSFAITTAPDLTVLTNTPLLRVVPTPDGSQTWHFAPSKPLSSYLVAWVIGRLEGTPISIVQRTPIQVWTLQRKAALGRFAHDYTVRLLPWYEDYFDMPYHFGKYDQIGVPGFALGAMETAGLVMFRQNALLLDAQTAAWQNEKSIAVTIAHEFAHMWFGDLATVQWWDDVWLSEAFAEWLGYKVVDWLSPDYEIWNDFQAGKNHALETDALLSTHPIYSPVATSAEAIEMFDAITYLKGCAVLRMLEHFLEAEPFRAGLRRYMREFAERNATSADLWRNLQAASHQPVAAMMTTWIMQPGYPVVHVRYQANGDHASLQLRQERFFSAPEVAVQPAVQWAVPLVIRYADAAGQHTLRFVLAETEANLDLPLDGPLLWCYANAAEIGFYRQHLDPALLGALLAHITTLSAPEQMGLLADQWALTRNATQSIAQYLNTLAALLPCSHYNVMEQIVQHLRTLADLLIEAADPVAHDRFRQWIADAWAPQLARLGFEPQPGETAAVAQQRAALVDALATLAEQPDVIATASALAAREAADPTAIDPSLAPIVISASATFGDLARFEHHVSIYQQRKASSAAPQEHLRYLRSLGLFRDPAAITRLLDLITDHTIAQESVAQTLSQLLAYPHSQAAAWAYISTHWATLNAISSTTMPTLMEAAGHLPASQRSALVEFYTTHLSGIAHQSYTRALEQIDQRTEFQTRTRPTLVAWFRNHEWGE